VLVIIVLADHPVNQIGNLVELGEPGMQAARATIVHNPRETRLESIALHLHADQDIEAEDADALMDSLRSQCQHLLCIRQVAAQ
jgi:hypothetical protein